MKRHLLIEIDAGETTCERCVYRYRKWREGPLFCALFVGDHVPGAGRMKRVDEDKRLPECLAAAQAAKAGRE